MGFDCFGNCANKNIELRLDDDRSDSLVNDQILREIEELSRDASFTDYAESISRFFNILN
jgi:hypothetical protein